MSLEIARVALGLWRPHWSLQHVPAHRRDRPVDSGRKDAVPIVEDEPVGCLRGDDHAKLLDRPLRRRMLGDIPVEDPTRADLENDEHMRTRKPTVTAVKKSRATTARHDSAQTSPKRWDRLPPCGGRRLRMYRPTVRGDTASPNLRRSSFAIRSSRRVGPGNFIPSLSQIRA
jgi:hypothetical protein